MMVVYESSFIKFPIEATPAIHVLPILSPFLAILENGLAGAALVILILRRSEGRKTHHVLHQLLIISLSLLLLSLLLVLRLLSLLCLRLSFLFVLELTLLLISGPGPRMLILAR
jgi:hypothetical protein